MSITLLVNAGLQLWNLEGSVLTGKRTLALKDLIGGSGKAMLLTS